MRVEDLKEILESCYEDMEIVVDTEAIDCQNAEVVGIDMN